MIAPWRNSRATAELLPNSAEVPLTAAFIYKRQNRFRDRFRRLASRRGAGPAEPQSAGIPDHHTSMGPRLARSFAHIRPSMCAGAEGIAVLVVVVARANDEFRLSGDINALKKAIAEEADGGAPVRFRLAQCGAI